MVPIRLLAAILLLLPAAVLPQPRGFAAVVTHVTDGDTVWVRPTRGGRRLEVRLAGIDAPEICQRFGEQSREALAQQILRRRVLIEEQGRDDYGRVIARVHRSGEDVGGWLVAHGLAWSPGFRRQPGPYDAQQSQARQARRGLWASPHPLEPRTFRRLHGPCTTAQDKR
jgi:micrococcal nuclease